MRSVRKIGQGRTAEIFELSEDNQIIIKLYNQNVPETDIHREFHTSRLAHSLGIQTPKPIEMTRIDNRNGILFQRVNGLSLLERISKSPLAIKQHSMKLAKLHHSLHRHQADGHLVRQKQVLEQMIQSNAVLTDNEKDIILDRLEKLPDDNRFCHGDFHPDNVMVGEKDWVLDWLTGTSGSPAGDVARTILLLGVGSMPPETPRYMITFVNLFRKRLQQRYAKEYLKLSGMDHAEIDKWMLPVAAARLNEWIPQEEQEILLDIVRKRIRTIGA